MDFCIKHILGKVSQGPDPKIYAPRTRVTPNGVGFTFPRRRSKSSVNLKDDFVAYYKRQGCKVVYVGDGTSDFPAMKIADIRFAIKGSRLAELCRDNEIQFSQINSFEPVIDEVVNLSAASITTV